MPARSRRQWGSATWGRTLNLAVTAEQDKPSAQGDEDAKERKAAEDVERFQPLVGNHRSELRHGSEFIPALAVEAGTAARGKGRLDGLQRLTIHRRARRLGETLLSGFASGCRRAAADG